jgi:hypothetical protein
MPQSRGWPPIQAGRGSFFLSDGTSPFKANDRWHDENNATDMVTLSSQNCPSGSVSCTFNYYGVAIDAGGGEHIIDPKIIVNPNARPRTAAR